MAVFKKDNSKRGTKDTWTAKFYYKDHNGEPKQKKKEGFKTQREAKEFEREYLDKFNTKNDILFSSVVSNYYERIEVTLKPTTLENKKQLINNKILPFFENMSLIEIEPQTVEKWQNQLMSQGYSPTYLKSIHNQLSAIFNYSIRFLKQTANPARVAGSMGKKNADKMNFYTHDEFKQFIAVFKDKPELEMIYTLLFYTGIRLGELLALKPDDFDFDNHTMRIDENLQRVNGQSILQKPKTKKSTRSITLPEGLSLKVKNYIDKLPNITPTDLIFNVSKSHLGNHMKIGAEKAKLKRVRVHDLRHSHASHLIELKFAPLIISERLGHEDIRTTLQTYSHLYPNKDLEIATRLNDCF